MAKTVYLTGKCKWAKLKDPDKKYSVWTLDLYLDEKGLKNFAAADLELQLRDSDEGPFIKLRRPTSRLDRKTDQVVKFNPPKVIDADGEPWDMKVLIGNGSEVDVKIDVYPTPKGNAHRLEAVRVTKLVEYGGIIGDVEDDFVVF